MKVSHPGIPGWRIRGLVNAANEPSKAKRACPWLFAAWLSFPNYTGLSLFDAEVIHLHMKLKSPSMRAKCKISTLALHLYEVTTVQNVEILTQISTVIVYLLIEPRLP